MVSRGSQRARPASRPLARAAERTNAERNAERTKPSRVSWSRAAWSLPSLLLALVGCSAVLGLDPREGGLADGGPCEDARDCASDHCVAAICCDTACNDGCQECATGTCGPMPLGTSCDSVADGVCNGDGACLGAHGAACDARQMGAECVSGLCGAYGAACDANEDNASCPGLCCTNDCTDGDCARCQGLSCDAGEDCAPGLVCVGGDPSREGREGTCCASACSTEERCAKDGSRCEGPLGASCGADSDCQSGHCADAVCCDSDCGTCETCNAAGVCGPDPRDTPDPPCLEQASCDGAGACRTVVGVTAMAYGGCARLSDGAVKCWGQGWPKGGTPTEIPELENAKLLAGGGLHVCAIGANDELQCVGVAAGKPLPFVLTEPLEAVLDVDGVAAGPSALTAPSGQASPIDLKCWSWNWVAQPAAFLPVATPAATHSAANMTVTKRLAFGCGHVCTIDGLGAVKCVEVPSLLCGYNVNGEVGNGTFVPQKKFVTATGFDGSPSQRAVAIAAGTLHTCAIREDGTVWCWGDNTSGQLGPSVAKDPNSALPALVDLCGGAPCGDTDKAAALALGTTHSCAVLKSGTVRCWGDNTFAQLGDGTHISSATPVMGSVAGTAATHRQAIAAGTAHTCVVTQTGGLKCFGSDAYGQLGGTTVGDGGDSVGL